MKELFLSQLRNSQTELPQFRQAAGQLASLMAQEAASTLPLVRSPIRTPFAETTGSHLPHPIVLIAILRAGLVFLPPFLSLFPSASIGFFGIRRDEKTANPHLYLENLPAIGADAYIFLLDPMLATGGTANLALDRIHSKGASADRIHLVTFLSASQGRDAVQKRHPAVKIHTAATDPSLTPHHYIVPGLGDFGHRYFGA
jgi:uracil phosphoribosyltransferase